MTLAEVVAAHISRTLAECGGNISQAARELGIRRQSLQRKLTALGLRPPVVRYEAIGG